MWEKNPRGSCCFEGENLEKHCAQYDQKLYLFRSSNKTQSECFTYWLFAESERYLGEVSRMSKNDLLILYNKDTGDIIGPFKPVEWGERLEKGVFNEYPAQVRVKPIDQIHRIRDARSKYDWVQELMKIIKDKTLIIPEKYANKLINILESSEVVTIEELLNSPYEVSLVDFLNKNKIMFLRIDQEARNFSEYLKVKGGKRPDFLIFLEGHFHAVEVKGREVINDVFFGVLVHVTEVEKLKIFSELTSIPVHIAYIELEDEGSFHTIPIDELSSSSKKSEISGTEYYYLEHYRLIESNKIHKEKCIFCRMSKINKQ